MKQHPTIPAAPRNLQRAEGKCNLQLATRQRRLQPFESHSKHKTEVVLSFTFVFR